MKTALPFAFKPFARASARLGCRASHARAYARLLSASWRPGEALFLANGADDLPAALLGNAGELELDAEGWALIPYSESRHNGRDGRQLANAADGTPPVPVVQRFDRAAAEAIAADFNSPLNRFKRFIVGLPIFKGHPDAPRFAARFPDKMPRGTVAEMQVAENGLRFRPVLTGEGASLVSTDGWSAFSPYWRSQFKGLVDGVRIYSPDKLVSIGLLPPGKENISGLSLANAVDADDALQTANASDSAMNKILIALLAKLGLTAPADANEAQLSALADQATGVIAAANAKDGTIATLTAEKKALGDQLAAANQAKTDALALANTKDGEIATTKEQLANERKARARLVVLGAVQTGRVVAAEVDAETLTLANATDFDAAAAAISARAVKLHTQSGLGSLGAQGNDGKSRTEQVLLLVNARMDEDAAIKALPIGQRYDAAFAAVEADPKHAALFAAMKAPAAKA